MIVLRRKVPWYLEDGHFDDVLTMIILMIPILKLEDYHFVDILKITILMISWRWSFWWCFEWRSGEKSFHSWWLPWSRPRGDQPSYRQRPLSGRTIKLVTLFSSLKQIDYFTGASLNPKLKQIDLTIFQDQVQDKLMSLFFRSKFKTNWHYNYEYDVTIFKEQTPKAAPSTSVLNLGGGGEGSIWLWRSFRWKWWRSKWGVSQQMNLNIKRPFGLSVR